MLYNLLIKSEARAMKKLSKKKKFIFDYRYILGLCTGSIITGTSAYAITVAENTVIYDNTNSGLTSTDVQSAIMRYTQKPIVVIYH